MPEYKHTVASDVVLETLEAGKDPVKVTLELVRSNYAIAERLAALVDQVYDSTALQDSNDSRLVMAVQDLTAVVHQK